MKAVISMAAAAVILSACAGQQVNPDAQSFVGKNVSALTSRLGSPKKEKAESGDTLYSWTKVETVDGIVDGEEFQASQSAQGSSRFNATQCKLRATADSSDVIKSFHTDGICGRTLDMLQK
jgi:hypothetical protein